MFGTFPDPSVTKYAGVFMVSPMVGPYDQVWPKNRDVKPRITGVSEGNLCTFWAEDFPDSDLTFIVQALCLRT